MLANKHRPSEQTLATARLAAPTTNRIINNLSTANTLIYCLDTQDCFSADTTLSRSLQQTLCIAARCSTSHQFLSYSFDCLHSQISLVYASHPTATPVDFLRLRSTHISPAQHATRRVLRLTITTTTPKMDSDVDSMVFDDDFQEESDGYSPEPVSATFIQ